MAAYEPISRNVLENAMSAVSQAPLFDTAQAPAEKLADFASRLNYEAVPAEVVARAKLLILDALGVGLASNVYPFAGRALAGITALAEHDGVCSVLGRPERLPVRDAALANGILIHGLDFDDTHLKSIIHASAACLPCALSLAESIGASGREFLVAYMAGMETAVRVGAAVKGGFHHVGFHATGVVAHFSSAVIASKLLGLDASQIISAQGIAASTASGVQVFLEEGAWTKRFHPGWAAVAGITAARLAQGGFKGPSRPYEGRFGLLHAYLQDYAKQADISLIVDGLGEAWSFAETAIKPYPVCHFIHGCADAAIELSRLVDAADIAAVEAFLPRDTMPIVAEPLAAKQNPTTDYEAKFSAPFVVAACLIKGRFGLPDLQPEALQDPTVLDLTRRVRCSIDPNSAFPTYFSGGVEVTLRDGSKLTRHVRVNSGAGDRALDLDGVTEKFLASATLAIPEDQALEIRDLVLDIENRPLGDLAGALRAR
jgi:2-methylcitrate dehydratase PrpD